MGIIGKLSPDKYRQEPRSKSGRMLKNFKIKK